MTLHEYARELVAKRLDNVSLAVASKQEKAARAAAWDYVLDALEACKDAHEGTDKWKGSAEMP